MDILTQIILPLILAFIMFSMGLSLVLDDFKRIAKYPKAFLIGAFLQLVSLPVLAYFLTKIWMSMGTIDPALAVGMMIIAACPGGVTSNLMTHLGGGDSALSISLTAVMSVLSVFTIPLIINYGFYAFMSEGNQTALPVAKTIIGIFCITTVPVSIGMLINHKKPNFAQKFEPVARKIASICFVIIILAAFAKKWDLLIETIFSLGPITLALNLATMIVAFLVARAFNLNPKQNIAIIFECGLQNGTLAIMIAATFLRNDVMMLPGGIYSLLMFLTGGALLIALRLPKRTP